jgi:N-acyl-D-aspartate/D-glutamate deacylase
VGAGLRRAGKGVIQFVSDFENLELEWPVILAMAEASGRPVSMTVADQFSFFPVEGATTGFDVLDRITAARHSGLAMSAQVAPRAVGLTMGLSTTLNPFLACPPWEEVDPLPLAEKVAALRSGPLRDRLLASYSGQVDQDKLGGSVISKLDAMVRLADPPDYEQPASASIAAIAARTGRAAHEVALDVMLEDDGRGLLYLAATNYQHWNYDDVRKMLTHPFAVPGLSDGGAHVGTICDASFPTYLLSYWGRQRSRGQLPVQFLVERLTRASAQAVDLHDRGVLASGYRADINVIDLEKLVVRRPEMHFDLPAGGRRFLQRADGYLHTFVAGTETYREGLSTGATPGRLVRGNRPALV